jgi:hypothetical protein
MKKITFILIILISTLSCENNNKKKLHSTEISSEEKVNTTKKTELKNDALKFEQYRSTENDELNKLSIEFDEFRLIINNYSTFDDSIFIEKDTLILDEELGFSFENRLIEIQPKNKLDKFELSIALENNLTVYVGEKQFEDLENWKKIGQYEKLKDSSKFYFRLPYYNREQKEQKLNKDFDKIKNEVLKIEGDYITEEIKNVESINKLPIEFWISRALLQIIRTDENGEMEKIILINNSSWGC